MKTAIPGLLAAGLCLLAGLLGGCTFTDALESQACAVDSDCAAEHECGPDGFCVRSAIGDEELPCDGACGSAETCDEATDTCVCAAPDGSSSICAEDQICCAGAGCVGVADDTAHCGACGTACGAGESCVGGACVCGELRADSGGAACASPNGCCQLGDGTFKCVDPRFDPACCGTLESHVDCGDQLCQTGSCVCGAGSDTCPRDATGEAICATDILRDPQHCGSCGNDCGDLGCTAGACSCGGAACGSMESCCAVGDATSCINTDTSRQHCGGCGQKCGVGQECVGGACSCGGGPACAEGTICCGPAGARECLPPDDALCICGDSACGAQAPDCCSDICVDLSADANNCGDCGVVCGDGQSCIGGACFCDDPALTRCDGTCVDLLSNDDHCSTCGSGCGNGTVCCGGTCTDLSSSTANCGACGAFCGGDSCVDGQCSCGGTPVNLDIDVDNCGQCARSCDAPRLSGEACISGMCRYDTATCDANWGDCNADKAADGCETDLGASDAHCGACGNACVAPAYCAAGQCVTVDVIVDVTLGTGFSCALHQSGLVECWGKGGVGQIGNGMTADQQTPVVLPDLNALAISAGTDHACAIKDDRSVVCWGQDDKGEVGLSSSGVRSSPGSVGGLPGGAQQIAAGHEHTCAVINNAAGADGEVWCWGRDDKGQLGSTGGDTTTARKVDTLTGIIAVSAGEKHTCALAGDGSVWCWGRDDKGQAGDGAPSNDKNAPVQLAGFGTVLEVDAGRKFNLALVQPDALWAWGNDNYRQLVTPSSGDKNSPTDTTHNGFAAISAGYETGCAVTTGGAAQCWGRNDQGQAGNGNHDSPLTTPTQVTGLTSGVVDIDVAFDHGCAVMSPTAASNPGGVKCWGKDDGGKLGNSDSHGDSDLPMNVVGLP